eukprot:CAMPEP_0202856200 /NCGR_PEP_ID=MMETSP1389-20130828/91912_1 /ASSEMBLY_ACC=CAM_ASM_000865 /TAXON_ID=302021 /ORGANISM="Rhodomonas sp., Strain CCMP768" /LENGTH=277 /DNA_ID=CAMNT_0049534845 /DNA_START=369 /DNA_END=1199 /DNA_ORIENTATION=+
MADDEDRVALALELVDDGVEPLHHVQVRLPARVPVSELVLPTHLELLRIDLLDLLVRLPIEDARVDLVERVPPTRTHRDPLLPVRHDLLVPYVHAGLYGALQSARPQPRPRLVVEDVGVDVVCEGEGVVASVLGERRVPSDLLREIVLALAVPCEVDGFGCGVKIHHKRRDAARKVSEDLIQHHLLSSVDGFDPREARIGVGERLVVLRVDRDPLLEVCHRLCLVLADVVWHVEFCLADVVLDDLLVVAQDSTKMMCERDCSIGPSSSTSHFLLSRV